ncbi:ATP-binding protein [Moraxellaceae bacterium AER2_44_116]|nr:ATP-binding protein [Moraxellaceae bacterium]TQC99278.1 ATP-binding protein [Moraxellaceae bacterium AER2_44_116]
MKLGGIAYGDSFFGRQIEQASFWRYIEQDNILLSGARRLGKSSLINRICENATPMGWLARMVDVQDCDSAEMFIAHLNQAFPTQDISSHLANLGEQASFLLQKLKKIEVKGPAGVGLALELQGAAVPAWQVAGQQLRQRLENTPVLIFIDEFSVFLQRLIHKNKAEAESLVAWLCAWRKQPNMASRFLFTGSICLTALLEKHQLHTYFNDCHDMTLGAFSPSDAENMLIEFAQRRTWELKPITAKDVMARVGWLSPYMLNKLLDEVMNAGEDRLTESRQSLRVITNDDVEAGYDRLLSKRSIFIHWQQRLERDLLEPTLSFAKAVLTALSNSAGQGLTITQLKARLAKREPDSDKRSVLLQSVLIILADEGYITTPNANKQVQFLSFPLQDWWRRNHV